MNRHILFEVTGVRYLALSGLRTSGAFHAISRSARRKRRLLILCYHGASLRDEQEWYPQLFVTPEFLRARLSLIQNTGCNVLPLGKAIRLLHTNALPPRSVVLTLDDGFYNFLSAAMPILKEFGYPATNFVTQVAMWTQCFFHGCEKWA